MTYSAIESELEQEFRELAILVDVLSTERNKLKTTNAMLLEALELAKATIERLTSVDNAKRGSCAGTLDVARAAIKAAKGE